jgi:DNA-binding NtrC family response regulator
MALPPVVMQAAFSRRPAESAVRVLVVDDDMRIADTTAEVLQLAGFEAKAAYSGQSALELARSFQPNCLLSDVLMHGMNGVELAQSMQQHYPETRIVLMSGQAGVSEILDQALRQGLEFELLPKPIHPRKLIDHLRQPGNGG